MVLHPEVTLKVKLESISNNHEENRNKLRKLVVDFFIQEKAGHGTGEDASNYKYIVEKLASGDRIYLTRPVPLNKGFDFIIHVEGHTFSNNKDNPKHSDITEDLKNKKNQEELFNKLLEALERVYSCEDPDDIYNDYQDIFESNQSGLSPELILKVIKWLFIEQDIRYWNWSGRSMFMKGIREV